MKSVLDASPDPGWGLDEYGYSPLREMGVESRFALSNGFLGVRGSRSASRGSTWVSWLHHLNWASWPRTFVAGLFDTPNTEPAVPALVPTPDWFRFRVVFNGVPLRLHSGEVVTHRRTLDMRRAILVVEWRHRDPQGLGIRLRSLRMVSLAERSLGLQLVQFQLDQPGSVTFEASVEVANAGLEVVEIQPGLGLWQTAESGKHLAIASHAQLNIAGVTREPSSQVHLTRNWSWTGDPSQVITFWRTVSVARDDWHGHPPDASAQRSLARAVQAGPIRLLEAHEAAWSERWLHADVCVEGDESAQRALRYAVYHLIAAANPDDERVSIGARALTGDAYLGHVFWDTENYLLPFYTFTWPAAARAMLMYRYHTLPAARAKAIRLGYKGAFYAWESADTGEETTPDVIVGPDGHNLTVLTGRLEQHISADIAYAVWQYWLVTQDVAFLLDAGAEIVLETARFWASRVQLDADGRYHIRNVIGPDEYHEHVDDNAYTNVMARWNLERALEVAALLAGHWPDAWQRLTGALGFNSAELAEWRDIVDRMATGVDQANGRIEQFSGYFDLEDIDLGQYAGRTVPLEVVLGRERAQKSQVVKQADVVMLLALLPERFDLQVQAMNLAYYEPRTGHGSSLSRAVHAVVAARVGNMQLAERYFRETAATDLEDSSAGIGGGVRIAAQGGLWQAALYGFAGLALAEDGLKLTPRLPGAWNVLSFRVQWRGRQVHVRLDGGQRHMSAVLETGEPMRLYLGAVVHELHPAQVLEASWDEPDGGTTSAPSITSSSSR